MDTSVRYLHYLEYGQFNLAPLAVHFIESKLSEIWISLLHIVKVDLPELLFRDV